MSDPGPSPSPEQAAETGTLAARLALKQRAGGIIVPLFTVIFAFLMSFVIVAATQHSLHTGLVVFKEIFDGSGLNWIAHPTTNTFTSIAAYNLSQTLLQTAPLILTGLAVAFAFRCGMFNIGGNGQYLVGLIVANWLGVDFAGLNPFLHILLCMSAGTVAAAAFAAIAGILKATVGAHEVISTIMLNWIAYWIGVMALRHRRGAAELDEPDEPGLEPVSPGARLPDFWGKQGFQGLHIGIFVSLAALVVFWIAAEPDDARLRGARGRVQPGRGGVRRHQREEELHPRDGDLGRVRRARGNARHARRTRLPLSVSSTSRSSRSASSASPSRCSAATRRSAPCWARCSSAAFSTGASTAWAARA